MLGRTDENNACWAETNPPKPPVFADPGTTPRSVAERAITRSAWLYRCGLVAVWPLSRQRDDAVISLGLLVNVDGRIHPELN